MTQAPADHLTDPALEIAERQLAMLGALGQIAMEVSCAYGAAAIAASHAVEVILADEYYQPETGRARALAGAKDAADGFQKAARSVRLTLALELATAETLRTLRAGGVFSASQRADETPACGLNLAETRSAPERRRPADTPSDNEAPDFDKRDTERLVEFDRPDRLPRGEFREIVDALCTDIDVTPDWRRWAVDEPALTYRPLRPRPPGWSECRPPRPIESPEFAMEPAAPP